MLWSAVMTGSPGPLHRNRPVGEKVTQHRDVRAPLWSTSRCSAVWNLTGSRLHVEKSVPEPRFRTEEQYTQVQHACQPPCQARASIRPRVPLCCVKPHLLALNASDRSLFVGDHEMPEVVGEASLQAAHSFVSGLALGDLLVEVAASEAIGHTDLGDRDEVDRGVQLSVALTRQAVAGPCAGCDLDGGRSRRRWRTGEP